MRRRTGPAPAVRRRAVRVRAVGRWAVRVRTVGRWAARVPAVRRWAVRVRASRRWAWPVLVLVALVAGCGVPVDENPRTVTGAAPPAAAPPAPSGAGPAVERLCLVRDDHLVRVARRVPALRSAEAHLGDLLAGPTGEENRAGLTSALTTAGGVTMTLAAGRAVVEVGDVVTQGGRSDQVLAFGQIVCTLGSRLDVGTVAFTSGGRPLGVPRADGSLAEGPVTIADYAGLITS